MEDVLIVLGAVFALVMVVVILVYNRFDRLNFRIERQLKYGREPLDRWARVCGQLKPGSDRAYFQAKKDRERMACLREMIRTVDMQSEEKLDLQEELLEFCSSYSEMARRYDELLDSPVLGRIGRWIGCKPWGGLDFYPDIKSSV